MTAPSCIAALAAAVRVGADLVDVRASAVRTLFAPLSEIERGWRCILAALPAQEDRTEVSTGRPRVAARRLQHAVGPARRHQVSLAIPARPVRLESELGKG
jgi:hypothetical protein